MKRIVLFALGLVLTFNSALACKCGKLELSIEYYHAMDAVFIGEVIEVKRSTRFTTLKFSVKKKYKGPNRASIVIKSLNSSCSLGGLEVGESWLMHAYKKGGHLATNRCTLSKLSGDPGFDEDTSFLSQISVSGNQIVRMGDGEGRLKKGKPDGEWKYSSYSSLNGQVLSSGMYKNGKKVGIWWEYKEDSTLLYQKYFKRGWIKWEKDYFNNGHVFWEDYYVFFGLIEKQTNKYSYDGHLDQVFKNYLFGLITKYEAYYPDGKLKEKGKVGILGNYWGKWKYYDEAGTLIKKEKPTD